MSRAITAIQHWLPRAAWLFPLLLVVTVVYAPGLHGPYVLDDDENIALNKAVAMSQFDWTALRAAALGNDSGPLKRPLASLSFALNHFFAGGFENTFAFKTTNLVIHLVNVVLVYWLTLLLGQTPALAGKLTKRKNTAFALAAAALWGLHPIQLTSVLYVVQRMNSLAALFVLAGLIVFVRGRLQLERRAPRGQMLMYLGVVGGALLGSMSKENALLLPLYAAVVDYTLFLRHSPPRNLRQRLMIFYGIVLALPLLACALYLAWNPSAITGTYITRHFSMLERVLTEARVLWLYVGLLLFPVSSRFSLFHDDIGISTAVWTPPSTLLAIAGLLVAVAIAFAQRKRYPLLSFAVLWFLAGHVLESTVLGLETVYEHRNYLPSYGILLAVSFGFLVLASAKKPAYALLPAAVCLILGFTTWVRAGIWSDVVTLSEHTAQSHPDSARANRFAARIKLSAHHDFSAAIRYTLRGMRAHPKELGFHIDLQMLLAAFANEIRADIATLPNLRDRKPGQLVVQGLDEPLDLVSDGRGIRLSHPMSTLERISGLIEAEQLSVHAIVAFESLRACLLNEPRPCAPIRKEATAWFTQAANSGRTSPTYQAVLAADTGLLYADAGDYASAEAYMRRAASLLPDFPNYQLATAEYLIRLGRLAEARTFLDELQQQFLPADPASLANVRNVENLYDAATSAAARSPAR